ncbi:hypothetical protein HUU05_09215 [candidate division KSB1 bacterium]|nr:hypothetical protein [candidate division KSB1 bacterium]
MMRNTIVALQIHAYEFTTSAQNLNIAALVSAMTTKTSLLNVIENAIEKGRLQ